MEYTWDLEIDQMMKEIEYDILKLRNEPLTESVVLNLREFFRIQHIYHSNAIEGSNLTLSETRAIVEDGLTIDGKSLREQSEAKNLNVALDFVEDIAKKNIPLTQREILEIHSIVLRGISDDAGRYRRTNVRITGSNHRPTEALFVQEEMDRLDEWLQSTKLNPIIVAAIAHTWFVSIHPFSDGNGRTARLLLNLILMRNGYPIAIIKKEQRPDYYDSLEESHSGDLTKVIKLIYHRVLETLREYQRMISEDRRAEEALSGIAEALQISNQRRLMAEFDVWKISMELLKAQFKATFARLEQHISDTHKINVSEYTGVDFDKFVAMREGEPAKGTWFFGVQIVDKEAQKRERFMFFFNPVSHSLGQKYPRTVSLTVSRYKEDQYKRLGDDPISLREVVIAGELFAVSEYEYMSRGTSIKKGQRASNIALKFVQDVIGNYFTR